MANTNVVNIECNSDSYFSDHSESDDDFYSSDDSGCSISDSDDSSDDVFGFANETKNEPKPHWFWSCENAAKPYDDNVSDSIEHAFKEAVIFHPIFKNKYQINFPRMSQVNVDTGFERHVMRGTWFIQNGVSLVPLFPANARRCEDAFTKELFGVKINIQGNNATHAILDTDMSGRGILYSSNIGVKWVILRGWYGKTVSRPLNATEKLKIAKKKYMDCLDKLQDRSHKKPTKSVKSPSSGGRGSVDRIKQENTALRKDLARVNQKFDMLKIAFDQLRQNSLGMAQKLETSNVVIDDLQRKYMTQVTENETLKEELESSAIDKTIDAFTPIS